MSFGRFLLLLLTRPRLALEQGKGRFLAASLALGSLAGGTSAYLFRLFSGSPIPINMLKLITVNLLAFLVLSLFYHVVARHYSGSTAPWSEFASLFGFAALPSVLSGLLTAAIMQFISMRSPYYPGLVSFGTGWFILSAAFSVAMGLAGIIYQGLVIQTVHRLPWKQVLATLAIVWLAEELLLSPLVQVNLSLSKLSWEAGTLMTEGVSKVDVSTNLYCSMETHRPTLEMGELVLANIPRLTINRRYYSDVPVKSRTVLAEIVAGPGETVELQSGTLLVNGKLVFQAPSALPHLTMGARELRPNQYFVYFRSPQALGRSVNPEHLLLSKADILGAVPESTLGYLEWQLR